MKRSLIVIIIFTVALISLFSCAETIERKGVITIEGKPLTLLGPEIKVGQRAPDFKLVAPFSYVEAFSESSEVKLSDNKGKIRLISVVPSLDTPVCDFQTQKFEEEASKFENVVFYTISMDLPFAQARYCSARNINQSLVLSDYYDSSFGLAYGLLIKEMHLLSRAIFIVGEDDTTEYVEYVKDISLPPDYNTALNALRTLVGLPAIQLPSTTEVTEGSKLGSLAPDFQLNNLDGETVSLSDYRGTPVLLNFWVTWCPHCQAERPWIQELFKEWQEEDLIILTIDMIGTGPGELAKNETQANLIAFMQNNGYTFPVLLDIRQEVKEQYGITATPTNFFIDKGGIIWKKKAGPFNSKAELEKSISELMYVNRQR